MCKQTWKTLTCSITCFFAGLSVMVISGLAIDQNLKLFTPAKMENEPDDDFKAGAYVIFIAAIMGIITGIVQAASLFLSLFGLHKTWSCLMISTSGFSFIIFIMALSASREFTDRHFHTVPKDITEVEITYEEENDDNHYAIAVGYMFITVANCCLAGALGLYMLLSKKARGVA